MTATHILMCEDDTIIRNKISLRRVIATGRTDGQFSYKFEINISTEADLPLKNNEVDQKSQMKTVEVKVPEDLDKELEFKTLSNRLQIYEIPDNDMFAFVKERINKIWLTKKTDIFGRPIYHVDVTGNVSVVDMKKM